MVHKITLLPGDGIGPEVTASVVAILDCAGVKVEWEKFVVGSEALARFGDPGDPADLVQGVAAAHGLPAQDLSAAAPPSRPPGIAGAAVHLSAGTYQSFGLAALEAMACGVPVIGTSAGGLPEVVEDGASGFLRPVGDVEGMADAALALLCDEERWARFSKEARRRAVEGFPTREIVSRYRKLYEETLG